MKHKLTQEQVNKLYSGLQEYVAVDLTCPNCTATDYDVEKHQSYVSYTCTDCGYDYYAINGETRLV